MRRYLGSIPLAAVGVIVFSTLATVHGNDLGPTVNQQLAGARAATAMYHDVDVAIADGYVNVGVNPSEGETVEFVKFGLIDCTLDALQPEALRYVASGDGLRLVAVEYSIPMDCTATPPEDFLPGAGEWEPEMVAPAWSMAVWIWSGQSQRHEPE
jgi:hypothetical protein